VTIKVLEQEDVQKIQRQQEDKKSKLDMSAARKVYKMMKEAQT